MANRVLCFMRARESRFDEATEARDRAAEAITEIEALVPGIEFYLPSVERILNRDADGEAGICFFVEREDCHAPIDTEDIAAWTIQQLRSQADELLAIAATIEGAIGKGV